MSRKLDAAELTRQLEDLPGWSGDEQAIRRSVEFPDFPTAIRAVVAVGEDAEAMDHHPDIDIRWRTVHFTLSTHSAGGVTQLDIELAHQIDQVAAALGG